MGKYGGATWHGLVNGGTQLRKGTVLEMVGGGTRGRQRMRAGPGRVARSGPRDPRHTRHTATKHGSRSRAPGPHGPQRVLKSETASEPETKQGCRTEPYPGTATPGKCPPAGLQGPPAPPRPHQPARCWRAGALQARVRPGCSVNQTRRPRNGSQRQNEQMKE